MSSPGERVAYLHGTDRQPEVWLYFDRADRHPALNVPLIEWVKRAPRRRWNPEQGCWIITAFGKDPDRVLTRAGFTINITEGPPGQGGLDPSLAGIVGLSDLYDPLARQSKVKPALALVRPRFAGYDGAREVLGEAAIWDRENGRFEVRLTELLRYGNPKEGLSVDAATIEAARATLVQKPTFGHDVHDDETLAKDAATLSLSTGLNLTDADSEGVARLIDVVGDVPAWFGMDLSPYQRLGAIAVAAGRTLLADPTGLGKTTQAIGALAIKDVDRAVVIVPPIVVTHWGREIERCGLAVPVPPKPRATRKRAKTTAAEEGAPGRGSDDPLAPPSTADLGRPGVTSVTALTDANHSGEADSPRFVVTFRAGRKEPELPDRGIIVVPDSLLTSRPALLARLAEWNPDALVYDEAHRARNWRSARAKAVRDLCERMRPGATRIPMTATPIFSSPHELVSLLAISGHLDSVFGGYTAFMTRYCKKNHFNAWVPNLLNLPELQQKLREQVWVRRQKAEVLKDLPPKSRRALYVDVDLAEFRTAHNEVIDKIDLWLDAFEEENGCLPDGETIKTYARQSIGLISPLRKAAGRAKVPVALDMVSDWITERVDMNADGTFTCDDPLVIWCHHQEVVEAIVEAASVHLKDTQRRLVAVIDGATSSTKRGSIVESFQAGKIPVLVCSITAAGVGVTLTRAADALFLETDWSAPVVSQAEDRLSRIGQERPVTCTTLVAEGTLDARLQKVLSSKGEIITAIVDDQDANVAVLDDEALDAGAAPWEIVRDLVEECISKRQAKPKKRAA